MVVQLSNYNEIEEFYHWARSFGADKVDYVMLDNWGTYSADEFNRLSVLEPSHIYYNDTINSLNKLKSQYSDNVLFYGFVI